MRCRYRSSPSACSAATPRAPKASCTSAVACHIALGFRTSSTMAQWSTPALSPTSCCRRERCPAETRDPRTAFPAPLLDQHRRPHQDPSSSSIVYRDQFLFFLPLADCVMRLDCLAILWRHGSIVYRHQFLFFSTTCRLCYAFGLPSNFMEPRIKAPI